MKVTIRTLLVGMAVGAGSLAAGNDAAACGGFFCQQIQPVNQAAERIIFADNGDGTQTAVIEIMYEGPSEHFSWLLPISSVPKGSDLAVASDLAFQRLQSATNPQYTLTTRVEGTCKQTNDRGSGGSAGTAGGFPASEGGAGDGGPVTVEASGVVGAFDWTVISVDTGTPKPSDAAVSWLNDNGYDVPAGAPALIAPYLESGLYLLALRLTKGSDVGSIRPISLTYDADRPMIPVKLTAVAANENMGVMAWVLGGSRAVPQNYLSLELNEARINWFNPAANYDAVVTEAADDAAGQGFVTEYAGASTSLAQVVWADWEESRFQKFANASSYPDLGDMFSETYYAYGGYDGFWDAVRATVTLPSAVSFETFQACPYCYLSDIEFDRTTYLAALDEQVIAPMRSVQALIDAHPALTRLYTTMSAEEMTLDPLFTFNPDLPDVSNVHTAERVIECSPAVYSFEAPWRIELPQGSTVRGTGDEAASLSWPPELAGLKPNRLITRQGETGSGKVVEDSLAEINAALDTYNATIPGPPDAPEAGAGGGTGASGGKGGTSSGGKGGSGSGAKGGSGSGAKGGTGTGGTQSSGGTGGASGEGDGSGATGGTPATPRPRAGSSSGGCAVTPGDANESVLASLVGLLFVGWRRRRVRR